MSSQPTSSVSPSRSTGGGFLFETVGSAPILTAEAASENQRLFYRTAMQFMRDGVMPQAGAIEAKKPGVLRKVLEQSAEIGLLAMEFPEAYGGLGADVTTSMMVGEASTLLASWSVTLGAQTGIGTLPILWFGNAAQKQKYLPKLGTGEWVSAYALTETGSGSDALGARTKAVLTPDGKHYLLNGSKQFITNAGFADVFIVFAKVDGEKFTCFIVDRDTPGFSIGAEEHKMGIRGSSTCPLILEDAKVPVENVVGEVGRGHKIAFNILNHGRLKLGVSVGGAIRHQLAAAYTYATERKQFGKALTEFGLIREKLSRMAVQSYANESMAYRTTGLIDAQMSGITAEAPEHDAKLIAAIEEFAIESSILKVSGSETYFSVIDDAVQVHGGYGFVEEFPVERAYRDNRIYRIFEGTNEVNRMLVTGMLLKRAMKGLVPLFEESGKAKTDFGSKALANEARAVESLKAIARFVLGVAVEAYGPAIESEQVVMASVADILIDTYALDSMVTRTWQATGDDKALATARQAAVTVHAQDVWARAMGRARKVLAAASAVEELEKNLAKLETFGTLPVVNTVALSEVVYSSVAEKSGYPFNDW